MRKKHNNKLVELSGWYGTIAIVSAYGLSSFLIITPHTLIYQLLNLTGAACLILDTIYKKDYQPAVLNIIWSVIALVAIGQIIF